MKRITGAMAATGIVPALQDLPLRDRDGARVGDIEQLLADATTNRPAWLVVRLGDGRRTVVPARGTRCTLEGTRTHHAAATVTACPVTLADHTLPRDHVVGICRHYGIPLPPGTWSDAFVAAGAPSAGTVRAVAA